MIRYNTDTDVFEGYDGQWITLNGVRDVDQDTYILAEQTPGSDDDTLYFYAGGQLVADVNQTRFNVNKLAVDDIEIEGNTVRTVTTNADLNLQANGTGKVIIENFGFNQNSITNSVAGAVTTLAQTGNGYFKIEGQGGFVIPVGDLTNRHPTPETGMMRFNTQDDRVEIYDQAGQWVSVAGSSGRRVGPGCFVLLQAGPVAAFGPVHCKDRARRVDSARRRRCRYAHARRRCRDAAQLPFAARLLLCLCCPTGSTGCRAPRPPGAGR